MAWLRVSTPPCGGANAGSGLCAAHFLWPFSSLGRFHAALACLPSHRRRLSDERQRCLGEAGGWGKPWRCCCCARALPVASMTGPGARGPAPAHSKEPVNTSLLEDLLEFAKSAKLYGLEPGLEAAMMTVQEDLLLVRRRLTACAAGGWVLGGGGGRGRELRCPPLQLPAARLCALRGT